MAFAAPTNIAIESFRSRRGRASADGSTEIDYIYHVVGSNDLQDIIDFAAATAPTTIIDPIDGGVMVQDNVDWDQQADEVWDLTVTYVTPDRYDARKFNNPDLGDYEFEVDTTGGTARITSALATTRYPAGATDHKGAIGKDAEGNVQGVDIVVPACRWTVTTRLAKASITNAYAMTVEALTGRTNDATFYGRAAGEVLFMGGNGRSGIKTDPVWRYSFVRMPNVAGLSIGGVITGIAKQGHQYLDVQWAAGDKDATSKRTQAKPIGAYVHTVYHSADFAALGIGT